MSRRSINNRRKSARWTDGSGVLNDDSNVKLGENSQWMKEPFIRASKNFSIDSSTGNVLDPDSRRPSEVTTNWHERLPNLDSDVGKKLKPRSTQSPESSNHANTTENSEASSTYVKKKKRPGFTNRKITNDNSTDFSKIIAGPGSKENTIGHSSPNKTNQEIERIGIIEKVDELLPSKTLDVSKNTTESLIKGFVKRRPKFSQKINQSNNKTNKTGNTFDKILNDSSSEEQDNIESPRVDKSNRIIENIEQQNITLANSASIVGSRRNEKLHDKSHASLSSQKNKKDQTYNKTENKVVEMSITQGVDAVIDTRETQIDNEDSSKSLSSHNISFSENIQSQKKKFSRNLDKVLTDISERTKETETQEFSNVSKVSQHLESQVADNRVLQISKDGQQLKDIISINSNTRKRPLTGSPHSASIQNKKTRLHTPDQETLTPNKSKSNNSSRKKSKLEQLVNQGKKITSEISSKENTLSDKQNDNFPNTNQLTFDSLHDTLRDQEKVVKPLKGNNENGSNSMIADSENSRSDTKDQDVSSVSKRQSSTFSSIKKGRSQSTSLVVASDSEDEWNFTPNKSKSANAKKVQSRSFHASRKSKAALSNDKSRKKAEESNTKIKEKNIRNVGSDNEDIYSGTATHNRSKSTKAKKVQSRSLNASQKLKTSTANDKSREEKKLSSMIIQEKTSTSEESDNEYAIFSGRSKSKKSISARGKKIRSPLLNASQKSKADSPNDQSQGEMEHNNPGIVGSDSEDADIYSGSSKREKSISAEGKKSHSRLFNSSQKSEANLPNDKSPREMEHSITEKLLPISNTPKLQKLDKNPQIFKPLVISTEDRPLPAQIHKSLSQTMRDSDISISSGDVSGNANKKLQSTLVPEGQPLSRLNVLAFENQISLSPIIKNAASSQLRRQIIAPPMIPLEKSVAKMPSNDQVAPLPSNKNTESIAPPRKPAPDDETSPKKSHHKTLTAETPGLLTREAPDLLTREAPNQSISEHSYEEPPLLSRDIANFTEKQNKSTVEVENSKLIRKKQKKSSAVVGTSKLTKKKPRKFSDEVGTSKLTKDMLIKVDQVMADFGRQEREKEERVKLQKNKSVQKNTLHKYFGGIIPKKNVAEKTTTKSQPVHNAYLVDGKIYKPPKLPSPKEWVTQRLYKHLWTRMEPKLGHLTRIKSEKVVRELSDFETLVYKKKVYEKFKDELENIYKLLAKYNIIATRWDFFHFCRDYMPRKFKEMVVPTIEFGNKRNMSFNPQQYMHGLILPNEIHQTDQHIPNNIERVENKNENEVEKRGTKEPISNKDKEKTQKEKKEQQHKKKLNIRQNEEENEREDNQAEEPNRKEERERRQKTLGYKKKLNSHENEEKNETEERAAGELQRMDERKKKEKKKERKGDKKKLNLSENEKGNETEESKAETPNTNENPKRKQEKEKQRDKRNINTRENEKEKRTEKKADKPNENEKLKRKQKEKRLDRRNINSSENEEEHETDESEVDKASKKEKSKRKQEKKEKHRYNGKVNNRENEKGNRTEEKVEKPNKKEKPQRNQEKKEKQRDKTNVSNSENEEEQETDESEVEKFNKTEKVKRKTEKEREKRGNDNEKENEVEESKAKKLKEKKEKRRSKRIKENSETKM